MTGVSGAMGRGRGKQTFVCLLTVAFAMSTGRAGLGQHWRMSPGGAPGLGSAMGAGTHATQGYFGVDVRDSGESPRTPHGAEILHVDHDAPAGKAGLREHDVVLMMNGQAVESGDALRRMLHEAPPGRVVALTITRGGQQQTVSAMMSTREDVEREAWEHVYPEVDPPVPPPSGELPPAHRGSGFFSAPGRAGRNLLGSMGSSAYTGVMLETMAPQLAEFFGAQGKSGMLVRSVDANSPASAAGLHAGDVVVRVNTVGIASNGDWTRVVRDNKGRAISVIVLRDRREQTLMLIPNAKHHSSLLPDIWPHFGGGSRSSAMGDHASAAPTTFFP